MLPDRVSNPGPLTYESGALLIAFFKMYADKSYTFSTSLKFVSFTALSPKHVVIYILFQYHNLQTFLQALK